MWNITLIGWWVLTNKSSSSSICLIFGSVCGGWAHAHSMTCLWPVQVFSCNASAFKMRYRAPRETLQWIEKRGSSTLPLPQLSLLSWITCIISDITCLFVFFSSCVDLLLLTSATLIVSPPQRVLMWSGALISVYVRQGKKSCHQEARNPFLFYFHTHAPFSHSMIPHVWPQDDRCCNGGADHAVSCVTPELILQEIVCSSDLWLTMAVSVTDYNVSQSKGV